MSTASERIGVALGAGAARGFAHVHVVRAFDDLGLKPAAIAGSSMGSVIGVGWAAGMSGQEITDYAIELWNNRTALLNRFWEKRGTKFGSLVANAFGFKTINAIEVMRVLLPHDLPEEFSDLGIPFAVNATDFYGHARVVFRSGSLLPAIAASSAIPGVFRPVPHDGRYLVDGGIMDPVPVDLLPDVDLSVAVDVIGGPMPKSDKDPSSIDILMGSHQLILQSLIQSRLAAAPPDLLLRPDVSRFNALNFFKAKEIIDATVPLREETKRRLDRLLSATTLTPLPDASVEDERARTPIGYDPSRTISIVKQ